MIAFFLVNLLHAQSQLSRGEYLARLAECYVCHTLDANPPLSGGLPISTPFGKFFTPNITPDFKTGIGGWTIVDFRRALRYGISPSGRIYYPAFPYRSFSKIDDEDVEEIYKYLRSVRAVSKVSRPHQLRFPYSQRWLMNFWKFLFFRGPVADPVENLKVGVGPFVAVRERSFKWNRGAYLVEAVLHCAECHTPRNYFGAPLANQWLAGSEIYLSGKNPPNITPDPATGRPWSAEQWTTFLQSGLTPRNTMPGKEMAEVIRATSQLTKDDRAAVIEYLMSQRSVRRSNEEP